MLRAADYFHADAIRCRRAAMRGLLMMLTPLRACCRARCHAADAIRHASYAATLLKYYTPLRHATPAADDAAMLPLALLIRRWPLPPHDT